MRPSLSQDAELFLQTRIQSLLHLDALLLLRYEANRWWSAETTAEALRISEASAGKVLEDLGAANMLDVKIMSSVMYRFAPVDPAVIPVIAEVAAVHYSDRQVVESVLAARRRGSEAAKRLADAFRFRGRKGDG